MKVKVYQSTVDKKRYGFATSDATELPQELAPWAFKRDLDLQPGEERIGVSADDVFEAFKANGYFVTAASIDVTEK